MHQFPSFDQIKRHLWIAGCDSRWHWWRLHLLAGMALVFNDVTFLSPDHFGQDSKHAAVMPFVWMVINLLLIWISVTSIVRRLHDRNKSGWWIVSYLVPLVGWVWLFIECGLLPGRPSRYAEEEPAPVAPPVAAPAAATAMPKRSPAAAVRRVGTVQRAEPRSWNGALLMKIARGAIGLIALAIGAYQWLHHSPANIGTDLQGTFKLGTPNSE
jgi:uncharacterized membrane protein YhaH (DUF805 family)